MVIHLSTTDPTPAWDISQELDTAVLSDGDEATWKSRLFPPQSNVQL